MNNTNVKIICPPMDSSEQSIQNEFSSRYDFNPLIIKIYC